MGFFSIVVSSKPPKKRRSHDSDRRTPKNAHTRDRDHDKPVDGSRKLLHSPDPPTSYQFREQGPILAFYRDVEELYKETFYDVALNTGTYYPCTQKELNASGGANRRMSLSAYKKDKKKWFARPNYGPFEDATTVVREVFDHNHPKRTPSLVEVDAINRLITGIKNACQGPWGPDLAIKAFSDLDKIFFAGRLQGHVCLTWKPINGSLRNSSETSYGKTLYLRQGKCVIQMYARDIFFFPDSGLGFVQMFATLLHEMCHAYLEVRAHASGRKGWMVDGPADHGKNFGTMIRAVDKKAMELFGLSGDPVWYPCHAYANDDDPRPAPKQPPAPTPPPPIQYRPTPTRNLRQRRRRDAFRDVSLDSGTVYDCTQSDLDVTGGLARHEYPEDARVDRSASHEKWFRKPNHGPFTGPRQACLEIVEHNDSRRKPEIPELEAIERLSNALRAGSRDDAWGPDLIIKAFCDLDVVFFCGRLRGHVCVRWLPNWSQERVPMFGETVFVGEGKCAIKLNADSILLDHPYPFVMMFGTLLHEMCHADTMVRVQKEKMAKLAEHGKEFGTKYHAVKKRARNIFDFSFKYCQEGVYPRYNYEKGEGFP